MRVLLIQPNNNPETLAGDQTSIHEPLALEYIASSIQDVCDYTFLDLRIEKKLSQTLLEYNPDIVGITGYTVHVNVINKIINDVKTFNSKIVTVIGGHHATVAADDFLEVSPTIINKGEGVSTFRKAIEFVQSGKPIESSKELNVVKKGNTNIINSIRPLYLPDWPNPDRNLSAKYRSQYFSYWMKPLASIRSADGCVHNCTFCSCWQLSNGKYYPRTPQSIVDELLTIKEKIIYFADDESFLHPNRMDKLADLIRNNNIKKKYHLFARADTIVKNKELFLKWHEIGLERLFVGFEAISDERLRQLGKNTSVSINNEAINFLKANKIQMLADFIIFQDFDKEDFESLKKIVKQYKLSSVIYTILTPMPGTHFFKRKQKDMINNRFEHFDVMHSLLPTKMPLQKFYKNFYNLYKSSGSLLEKLRFIFQLPLQEIIRLISIYGRITRKMKMFYINNSTAKRSEFPQLGK